VTIRLSTTLSNLEKSISSEVDMKTIQRFFDFMKMRKPTIRDHFKIHSNQQDGFLKNGSWETIFDKM